MEQTVITDLLPSRQLKDAIRASHHSFTDRELVQIAEQYAPTRKQRVSALEYIAAHSTDPRAKELAERLLSYHRDAMERMLSQEPDTVYVAEIREKPDSYLEHYPCRSFNAAMAVIHGFCQEYAVALSDQSTVEIKKYRVLGEDDDFDDFELGEICLNKDLEIASADYWPLEVNHFINADGTAASIRFPDFLPPCCPVSYSDFRGRHYGMQVDALRDDDDDYAYVIELDAESVNAQDLSGFGSAHLHVPVPLVEQLGTEQLPEKERSNYLRLESYLKERGLI